MNDKFSSPPSCCVLGFEEGIQFAFLPQNTHYLPTGVESLLLHPNLFSKQFVLIGPSPKLFEPPDSIKAAEDLLEELANDAEAFPFEYRIASLHNTYQRVIPYSDARVQREANKIREKRLSDETFYAALDDHHKQVDEANVHFIVLDHLIAHSLWVLDQMYFSGHAGHQHVVILLPAENYEPGITSHIIEHWLGLSKLTHESDRLDFTTWSPEGTGHPLNKYLTMDLLQERRNAGVLYGMESDLRGGPHLPRHTVKIDPSIEFKPGCGQPEDTETRLIVQPLLADTRGRFAIAHRLTINDLVVDILPCPREPEPLLRDLYSESWPLETNASKSVPRKSQLKSLKLIEGPIELGGRELVAGTKRQKGWVLLLNEEKQIGIGNAQFLKLLAFTTVASVSPEQGLDPAKPQIEQFSLAPVFTPADGKNPSSPQQKLREYFERVFEECELDKSEATRIFEKVGSNPATYRLTPQYLEVFDLSAIQDTENPSEEISTLTKLLMEEPLSPPDDQARYLSKWYAPCVEAFKNRHTRLRV